MADHAVELTTLDGARVLEIGRRLGVAAAGLALTAMGADVAQVHLSGRAIPRAEALYYDRGRRVLRDAEAASELAAMADVVLTDLGDDELARLGLSAAAEELRSGPDAQVLVSIRSLGRHGPNAGFRMTDLTEWASTGLAQVTRRPHEDLERYVPVRPPGHQAQALAGIAAATAALAGRRWARTSHQALVADVSVQEVANAMLHGIFPNYVWNGIVTGNPASMATSRGMLLPASDGDVYIRTLDPRQWDAFMDWVDSEVVRALGGTPDERLANNDAIMLLLGEWSSAQARLHLLEEGQRRRIPIALPRNLDDVLAWQQLRARGVWRTVDVAGEAGIVPRLPLLEPVSWGPATDSTVAEVASAWRRTP